MTTYTSHPVEPSTLWGLPRVDVPEAETWWPSLDVTMLTGVETVRTGIEETLLSIRPQRIALDIETRGTGTGRWTITCVTVAWHGPDGQMYSALLDPLRVPEQAELLRRVHAHAGTIVLHNAVFDIPPLYAHSLIAVEEINKVEDTLVLARMVRTYQKGKRTLEDLCEQYGVIHDGKVKIVAAMKAAGHKTKDAGYENSDIDRDFYRRGAMSDTAATLRVWGPLYADVMRTLVRGASGGYTVAKLDEAGAHNLINDMMAVLRITLRRSARGMAVDLDYAQRWRESKNAEQERAHAVIESAGLRPGVGADVIRYLHERGELPADWPTTEKGALKADKAAMELLTKADHPLSNAHTLIAEHGKTDGYFTAVEDASRATGRLHPSVGVLGAHASGRMSVADPPLQQFSEEARPIIVADRGDLWSADWSSIEPVVLANCAGDADFITPFNNGADLYVPVAKAAGLTPASMSNADARRHPGRDQAKIVLLASMYGMGQGTLAADLGVSLDQARALQNRLRSAMTETYTFMDAVKGACRQSGASWTISGRVLDERVVIDGRSEVMDRLAVNHFCQGSSADILMAATLQLERWGMADEVLMWIHDELVTTDEGVEAVKAAMQTPPDWLLAHSRLDPVLLVDAQNMGPAWQKV